MKSDRIVTVPVDSGVCIHHLSHPDVASFIERTNRYTGQPDRVRATADDPDLIAFAHRRIAYWTERNDCGATDDYPAAVGVLRAVYDIVDRLKSWEQDRGLDGAALFRKAQQILSLPHLSPPVVGRLGE